MRHRSREHRHMTLMRAAEQEPDMILDVETNQRVAQDIRHARTLFICAQMIGAWGRSVKRRPSAYPPWLGCAASGTDTRMRTVLPASSGIAEMPHSERTMWPSATTSFGRQS